ncbi:SAM hydrolase/SAM-dependent halogenase family protein [Halocatena halophila]|uniref:SAM hydrolase/SAM-dependent halogenase family protein n=1 Tax=Halocatena halophila TaxID=2814576 RepID=UPI002ED0AD64
MITLASDFGAPYPAAVRGVIARTTTSRIIDISHDFPRQDVRTAAFWLKELLVTFPPAVHCAVVDPGVGTDRAALVIRAGSHALVGPDNGLLLPAARALADTIEPFKWTIDDPDSATFHGRDVFAPAAARIDTVGVSAIEELEPVCPVDSVVDYQFPEPTIEDGRASGEILIVDNFGNAVTNIPGEMVPIAPGSSLRVNGQPVPFERSYAHCPRETSLVTVGSHGNLELAVNQGRGDEAFGVNPTTPVTIKWAD